MNNRELGSKKEELAIKYLEANGFKIIDRNYHFHKIGEIDIIARHIERVGKKDINYLVFTEVKYRGSISKGLASSAVNYSKQRRICKVAKGYLMEHGFMSDTPVRFDVIAIDGDKISWYKNAFAYIG